MPTPAITPDPIFSALRLGPNLTLKNRVLRASIGGRFDNEDGSLTQTRINWEQKFAAGGIGAIISSFVPVQMAGRIVPGFATIHRDEFIPLWAKVGQTAHAYDCKYILQLSHAGRQRDIPGVHNIGTPAPSATSWREPIHGFKSRAMSPLEIEDVVQAFAKGAWRAREAGLDGVELHAGHGYLFTQFLSSGINNRRDHYGGSLENRARFLMEVIAAIRAKVGRDFHLQVKLSAVDYNNVDPWEKKGNTLDDTIQIAKWCEAAGVDALHISMGSTFPHPLSPPGGLPLETYKDTYDAVIATGDHGIRNYIAISNPIFWPMIRYFWSRIAKGRPVEGVSMDDARRIKQAVTIPVLSTGGYQSASVVRDAITSGACDGVAISRALLANPDLLAHWRAGKEQPENPCTHCNKCLAHLIKDPVGCYDETRFASRAAMIDEVMSVYATHPNFVVPKRAADFGAQSRAAAE